MPDPYIGEIKLVGFTFAPNGWAKCEGQLLPISQNNALFSLFGTNYGGDGRTTFGLPDLRGRYPMGTGAGPGLTNRQIGQKAGSELNSIGLNNMPSHTHSAHVVSSTAEGNSTDPSGAFPARPEEPVQPYADTAGGLMAGGSVAVSPSGSNNPINNMPPFLAMTYIVALVGVYPSRP